MTNYFTEKQKKVLRQANARWNILYGATRSGKTRGSYFLIPQRIKEHYNHNILLTGKTVNTLERNVLAPMREIYGANNIGLISKTNQQVVLFGKKCYAIGANDERAITKIQGSGLGYAYCDELTTFPENFFEMLKSRLDLPNSRCDATCNPESPSHFVKKHIDKQGLDLYAEHFTIYDNTFLSKEFITNLENEYRGTIYFDRWILGKWVKTEGLVYPLFKREKHFLKPREFAEKYGMHSIKYVIWGGDGATTNDSTAIVPIAIMDNGQAVRLEMFYHNPKVNGQMSNEQLAPYIKRYVFELINKYKMYENGVEFYMPIDCAAADLIITLSYSLPSDMNVYKFTKKDIMRTTDVVNNALGRNAVILLDFGGYYNYIRNEFVECDDPLVDELEAMVWDKNGTGYDGTIPNDCADAFRYALCTFFNNPINLWETPGNEIY
jgi:PBSX family phage terminase large subunit